MDYNRKIIHHVYNILYFCMYKVSWLLEINKKEIFEIKIKNSKSHSYFYFYCFK